MAVSAALSATLFFLFSCPLVYCGLPSIPVTGHNFVINDVSYPARPVGAPQSYTAVYVIAEMDQELSVLCAHNVSGVSTVQWFLISDDSEPIPAPTGGEPSQFPREGNTLWYAEGPNLIFINTGVELEGVYRCEVGESVLLLDIQLTFENPYLRIPDGSNFTRTMIVDSLDLVAFSRYADPVTMRNAAPPVESISAVTVNGNMNLTIISANESNVNPYQTIYQVTRPESLVNDRIILSGLGVSSVVYTISVEDIYGDFPELTLVTEGDKVVLNCTPTQPTASVEFSAPPVSPPVPQIGNPIFNFTALVIYSGLYLCTAFDRIVRSTLLVVFPDEATDRAFFDGINNVIVPDGYIFLNAPQSESGIIALCVYRGESVSFTSENDTITEYFRNEEDEFSFGVGEDVVRLIHGEEFIGVTLFPTRMSYEDTITCTSDKSSSTVRIVAATDVVEVNGESSVTIDYGTPYNISFLFVSIFSEAVLRRNGQFFNRISTRDPSNSQIRNYLVDGLSSDTGNYTLTAETEVGDRANATLELIVRAPELTVTPDMTVNEGDTFILNCSIGVTNRNINYRWQTTAVVFQSGPTVTISEATGSNEGIYICNVFEGENVLVASASTTVNVTTSCPEELSGGILWGKVLETNLTTMPCQDADSRFSSVVQVIRQCTPNGWADPNFSGCTLASDEQETFAIFSLHYLLQGGNETQVRVNADILHEELDMVVSRAVGRDPFDSSDLVFFPSDIDDSDDGIFTIMRLCYTLNFNLTESEVRLISSLLHCETTINLPNSTIVLQRTRGDTFAFTRADICQCEPSRLPSNGILIDIPIREPRKKRQGEEECVYFGGIQDICNGTTASPCNCTTTDCQCSSPYVGDGTICSLDADGDSFPAVVPQSICDEGDNQISYCQKDSCPDVPNSPADNSSACEGFPTGVVTCDREVDSDWEIQWPFLPVGQTVILPCGVNYTGNASRMCGAGGNWAEPNVSNCSSRIITSLTVQIALLVGPGMEDVERSLELVEELAQETTEPLFPQDVESVIDNIDSVLTLLEGNLAKNNSASAVFSVLDNLLLDGNIESFNVLEEDEQDPAGSQVLDNVERYAIYLARVLDVDDGGDVRVNTTGENIVLRAANLNADNVQEDYMFPDPGEVEGVMFNNGTSASISLPQELLQKRGTNGRVNVASLLFRNLGAFLPNDSEVTHPRSLVISSQVNDQGGNGTADATLVQNPVIITFSFQARENETIDISQVRCVFWDFGGNSETTSDSEAVRWSTVGLTTQSVERVGDTITVTCTSNHLTSFAILVDVGGARIESEALSIVSYIGLAISLACLLLTIIFFLSFGKKLFTAVHNFVHLNLAIALFCGYAVFAFGVEFGNHEKIPCNLVTALIQYFLLAAFCWMMCEGVMLYLMLVVVFTRLSKKWWFFFLLGWGIPVVFVVIGLGALHEEYGIKHDSGVISDDYYKYCWLSSGEGTHAIWLFAAPMIAIIIINTVFLVLVVGSIVKSRSNRQKKIEAGYKVDVATTAVKASVILLPLLGLTWVFGLFAINENTAVFAWLFTIFNSLQGLFIFIFHVIRHDRIWGKMKKRYDKYSFTSRSSKTTGSTSAKSKYLSVGTSSGVEMKDRTSFVDPAAPSEVKVPLDDSAEHTKEPTKEEIA